MATIIDKLARNANGQPILTGCETLPPMESAPEPLQTPNDSRRSNGKPKNKRTTSDRFGVLNGFVDCSMAGLSRCELATWLVLYRDTRNGTATTSQADIARRAGLSDRAVRGGITKLRKLGLLEIVFQGGLNRGPSRYRVVSLRKLAS